MWREIAAGFLAVLLGFPAAAEEQKAGAAAASSTIVEMSWTVTAWANLKRPGPVGKAWRAAVDTAQKGVLKGYDLELKLVRWSRKNIFKPRPPVPPERVLTGFEAARELQWETAGFTELEQSDEHVTEGDRSCRATFLLPSDLSSRPATPWLASMRLESPARGPVPALAPTDWSGFRAFRCDIFNAATEEVRFSVALTDARGYRFEAGTSIPSGSATTFSMPIREVASARLDLARMTSLTLAVDTTSLAVRPVLFLDNLRFELPPPRVSATVLVDLSSTRTGLTRTATAGSK